VNPYAWYRKLSLGSQILVFMGIGVAAGVAFGERAMVVQPLGDLLIRLLMMAAIPLVFFNLLGGLTSLEDLTSLGRIAAKVSLFYLLTCLVALVLGLVTMHLLQPGAGFTLSGQVDANIGQMPGLMQILLDLVPDNVFKAFAAGKMTQIVVFAVFLAIATLRLPADQRAPLARAFDALARLFRALVQLVLALSPVGFGALMASTTGQYGPRLLGPLALFLTGVWGAQVTMVLVFILLLRTLGGISPRDFLRRTAPLYATTVSTCSSLASLAVALQLPRSDYGFPRASTPSPSRSGSAQQDRTCIMLVSVLLFTAQAAEVEFSLASQVTIVLVGLILETGSGHPGRGS
jgi:Na+/H+-dicarboxylate symporter